MRTWLIVAAIVLSAAIVSGTLIVIHLAEQPPQRSDAEKTIDRYLNDYVSIEAIRCMAGGGEYVFEPPQWICKESG